jgi:hypothetical protein
MHGEETELQSFDCTDQPITAGTTAAARPEHRPRVMEGDNAPSVPSLQSFECDAIPLPENAMAAPRPNGKERPNVDPNLAES